MTHAVGLPADHSPAVIARRVYDRRLLLSLYSTTVPLCPNAAERVRSLSLRAVCRLHRAGVCLRRYRGQRGGRSTRPAPCLRSLGNGSAVVLGNRPTPVAAAVRRTQSRLVRVHVDRHGASSGPELSLGCYNVRSLESKVDQLLAVRRDLSIDVLLLVESWHDSDSVCLRRLRADGFTVVDKPRPRARDDSLSTNHGGIVAAAVPGVRLTHVDIGSAPRTFEVLCVRVSSGTSSCVVVAVYRPGSAAITSSFFTDLSDVLDRTVTLADPIYVAGDFNIRLDRSEDPSTRQFAELLTAYGLSCRVTQPTHDRGGLLDVVATRDDLPTPFVDVMDVGLSDHRLLRWAAPLSRPCPVYTSVTSRPWRQLDIMSFHTALRSSQLCCPKTWNGLDIDELTQLYVAEITAILDRLIPVRTVRCRRRPSDPWFDEDCRAAKRQLRRLQSAARRADPSTSAAATAAWTSERRQYRDLLRLKRESFWQQKVDSERASPRRLWQSIDTLLGRGRVPVSPDASAADFHRFFEKKVADVRAATGTAPLPTFVSCSPDCVFDGFRLLTVDDVMTAVRMLPNKQCASDPLPTWLLKSSADVLAPYIVELVNRSLSGGLVPQEFKAAYITPLLKKATLDPADVKSYRPISNLSVMSKLLERLVARQLLDYLNSRRLLPELQSAYRAHHSAETAVVKVLSDILRALDAGDLTALTLLDLSAAFDTVDHPTLLRRLHESYGFRGSVLGWFKSYLSGRRQHVRCGVSKSIATLVLFGVPQGSVLGPILFLLYTADLLRLIQQHDLQPHLYADDTQILGVCGPSETQQLLEKLSLCIDDVAIWMSSNRLQLNASKTELLWCASNRRQHQIPASSLRVGTDHVAPAASVRNLGIYLDADASMRTHVAKTVSGCFGVLRQLRSIRRSVKRPVLKSLVAALVLTRLDYGNAALAGLPGTLCDRMQSVLNAAARLVFGTANSEHVTPLLRDLHMLRAPERIDYKLAVLVYRCLHGLAPPYLACNLCRVSDVESRQRLRSSATAQLLVPRVRRSTIGGRSFPVAAAQVWNSLPSNVTLSASLRIFKQTLKTELFIRSFPNPGASHY